MNTGSGNRTPQRCDNVTATLRVKVNDVRRLRNMHLRRWRLPWCRLVLAGCLQLSPEVQFCHARAGRWLRAGGAWRWRLSVEALQVRGERKGQRGESQEHAQ